MNKRVTANVTDTLRLPLKNTDGVIYFGTRWHADVPAIISNRGGNVTVNLPARSYKSAEVALYTVNGKRVMSGRVSSSNAVNSISRRNVSTGVYLLSVRGADGEAVTARLAHNGGGLNVSAAFGGADIADARKTAKKAEDATVAWTVTVSSDGYEDNVFMVQPVAGNNDLKTITLLVAHVDPNTVIKSVFTDDRNGRVYKTVKIGGQTWMAENINYMTSELSGNGAWCSWGNTANCDQYGALYNWATAKTVCPAGWHLPTRDEWGALAKAVGGTGDYGDGGTAGKMLKSTSSWGSSASFNGTDDYGFSALAVSHRDIDGGFDVAGNFGRWWTATEYSDESAYNRMMTYFDDEVNEGINNRSLGFSARCVKD